MSDKYSKKNITSFIAALNRLYVVLNLCVAKDPIADYMKRERTLKRVQNKYLKAHVEVSTLSDFWEDTEHYKRALLRMCRANIRSWNEALAIMSECKSLDSQRVGKFLFDRLKQIEYDAVNMPSDYLPDDPMLIRVMRWNNRGNAVEDLASISSSY